MRHSLLHWVLVAISVATVASGLGQLVMPGLVLDVLSSESTPATRHFFGIVGMFMVLFGGALLHALLGKAPQPVVVLWAGLQKFGAFAAVTLGVLSDLFSALALGVAAFDLVSGVLVLLYWNRVRHAAGRPAPGAGPTEA